MGDVVAYVETGLKYLQFAGGTFSRTWTRVWKLLGIIDFPHNVYVLGILNSSPWVTKLQCWNSSLPTPSVHRTVRYYYCPLPCSLPWPQNEQQYRTSAILPLKVPRKINIFKIHVQQYRTSELLPSKPPRKITISKTYEQQYRTSAIPPSKHMQ